MIEFLKKGGPQLKKAMEEAETETQNKGNHYSITFFFLKNGVHFFLLTNPFSYLLYSSNRPG